MSPSLIMFLVCSINNEGSFQCLKNGTRLFSPQPRFCSIDYNWRERWLLVIKIYGRETKFLPFSKLLPFDLPLLLVASSIESTETITTWIL